MSKPEKAYKNLSYLNSPAARPIRILTEYDEPRTRFLQHGVRDTIVFFGSARSRSQAESDAALQHAERELAHATSDEERRRLGHQVLQATRRVKLARYYEDARLLAHRLTLWSLGRPEGRRYLVCSGGGPGMMEAANRGASEAGGESVGLAISLPFEESLNPYVTPELGFEFHYFFMRKYWFMYLAKAMVMMPGGFGTMDELFEALTWAQLGLHRKPLGLVDTDGYYAPLAAWIRGALTQGFVPREMETALLVDPDPAALLERLLTHRVPESPVKWLGEKPVRR